KATAGPLRCVQAKVTIVPSGSREAEPFRVTREPAMTVWSGPASAIGGTFPPGGEETLMITRAGVEDRRSTGSSIPSLSSVTVNSNAKVAPDGPTLGAVKVGCSTAGFDKITAGPET